MIKKGVLTHQISEMNNLPNRSTPTWLIEISKQISTEMQF